MTGPWSKIRLIGATAIAVLACGRQPSLQTAERIGSFLEPLREAPDSSSARWLNLLPDGEEKRRFLLDCTGCHQFDGRIARANGRVRTRAEWQAVVERMLGYAGARSAFPVMAVDRDAAATAAWLALHLEQEPVLVGNAEARTRVPASGFVVTEYALPVAQELPHDVAVDAGGRVIVTGMFTHAMYVLDPRSGRFATEQIPIERANPRAVDIDSAGNWWVVLGAPMRLARRTPSGTWSSWAVGVYAHSLALDARGRVWFNGHFTRDPELVGAIDIASGAVRVDTLPRHPSLGTAAGGPIPYEIRLAPDGTLWMSELQGNRLVALDPQSGRTTVVDMPVRVSGPRRFDVDARGRLWIPAYASNSLLRFEPGTRRFIEYPLPIRDAVPYIARVDGGGTIWVGTAAADVVYRFDPVSARFTTITLPSRGALVRHLAIDPRTNDVWVAYGASPGIAARIARISSR